MGKSHLYHFEEQGLKEQFAKGFLSFYLGPFAKLNMEGRYGSHSVVRDAQTKDEEMSSLTRTIAICSGGLSQDTRRRVGLRGTRASVLPSIDRTDLNT